MRDGRGAADRAMCTGSPTSQDPGGSIVFGFAAQASMDMPKNVTDAIDRVPAK